MEARKQGSREIGLGRSQSTGLESKGLGTILAVDGQASKVYIQYATGMVV